MREQKYLLEVALHCVAVGVLIAAFVPVARWYYDFSPLWGVDFYYTVTLVKQLANSPVLWPAMGWNYAWFGGWPLVSSYPILHNFFIWLLALIFGLVAGVKIWMLVTLVGYFWGLYACFWVVSRNRPLAVMLAVAGIYSVGVYGSLMWGGSLPSQATQVFYPWVVWAIINFLRRGSFRWVFLAGLLAGLSILGHPQIAIAYIFPTVFLLLVSWFGEVNFGRRIRAGIVFGVLAIFIGLPILYGSAGDALKVLVVTGVHQKETAASTLRLPPTQLNTDIDNFHKAQPWRIIQDTNLTIYELGGVACVLWLVSVLIKFRQKGWGMVVATAVLVVFYVVYITIYAYGVSILHGGWYRLFWSTPLWLGLLASSWWGAAQEVLIKKLDKKSAWIAAVILGPIAIGVGISGLWVHNKGLYDRIIARSTASSAFPDVLNTQTSSLEFAKLEKKLAPAWLPVNNTNYRMYDSDQTVNIWWNALYKMPLARGYYDPPVNSEQKGYFFWTDAALSWDAKTQNDQLVGSFGYAPTAAKNNTLYLLDWSAIKYLEAGRVGLGNFSELPHWLATDDFIAKKEEVVFSGDDVYHDSKKQVLKYWEVKDQVVSPITAGENVPVIGIVASETGYENVQRAMADAGLNSQQLITLKWGKSLDGLGKAEIAAADAVVLYDYDYFDKDKAWGWVDKMLAAGKIVFVDTGIENKESTTDSLPDSLPITNTSRQGLGLTWDLTDLDPEVFAGVDVNGLAAPVFNGDPWSFSYPSNIKNGAVVLARNHGRIVMARVSRGNGTVIWSGMNLPYLVARAHLDQEVGLWKNLVGMLTKNKMAKVVNSQVVFKNAQSRTVIVSGARGILFKEEAYPGWIALENFRLRPIFKAGPSYPGFMYIPLPDTGLHKVEVWYVGSVTSWVLTGISALIVLMILDIILLRSLVGGVLYRRLSKIMGGWLSRDSEDL